jgi:hypothetical protein
VALRLHVDVRQPGKGGASLRTGTIFSIAESGGPRLFAG